MPTVSLAVEIFGMAAMPVPCNGIQLIQGNLPRIFPMFTLIMLSKLYFEIVRSSNLDNTFYDLFRHAYVSPDSHMKYTLWDLED